MASLGRLDAINILGIRIHSVTRSDVFNYIDFALNSPFFPRPLFIATVNPSFILKAQKNKEFKDILNNKTSLNVVDGIGVKMAFHYLKSVSKESTVFSKLYRGFYTGVSTGFSNKNTHLVPQVVTGIELTKYLLRIANKNNKRVLIVNRKDGMVSEKELKRYINLKYSKLNYSILSIPLSQYKTKIVDYGKSHIDILICTLGEVFEEIFISENLNKVCPGVAIGVGGTFDLLINKFRSTKTLYNSQGLKWLDRLLHNPKRGFKIFKSAVLFPLKVFLYSLS